MLAGFLLALVLANASVTGIVKDSTGGAVSGAAVIVRDDSGAEQQTVTGPDGRFTFDRAPDTGHADRQGRRVRREATADLWRQPGDRAGAGDPARDRHRHADENRAEPRHDGRERQRARAPNRSSSRRRWWPTMSCVASRRSACSAGRAACRRIRPRRACRSAASGRAASAAPWCCSTACRSTTRLAAGCTGRACRWKAPSASRSWTARRPACTATTRWAA